MFNPVILHRVAYWLHSHRIKKLPELVSRVNYFFTGCHLPASVIIGQRVKFQHFGAGVMANPNVAIEDDVIVMPGVVFGLNVLPGKQVMAGRIIVRKNVMLGVGAKIIASDYLEIGEAAAVGANAVVLKSVPPGYTAVGVPARLIPPKNAQVSEDLIASPLDTNKELSPLPASL